MTIQEAVDARGRLGVEVKRLRAEAREGDSPVVLARRDAAIAKLYAEGRLVVCDAVLAETATDVLLCTEIKWRNDGVTTVTKAPDGDGEFGAEAVCVYDAVLVES